MVRDIEKRVQSLSGVLASPTSEDDYAERGRRLELQRSGLVYIYTALLIPLRKLQGVLAKLEPLTDQNALVGFLRNANNVKVLTGFVQELADAITDYQARAFSPTTRYLMTVRLGLSATRSLREDEEHPREG